jgi:hypothetical protein
LQGELPDHGEAGCWGEALEVVRLDIAEPELSSRIGGTIYHHARPQKGLGYIKIT